MSFREKLKWLDPFTYVDLLVERINPFPMHSIARTAFDWGCFILFGFLFAWIAYQLLGIALSVQNPLFIVVSPSMEPTMYRGDLIILQGVKASELKGNEVVLGYDSLKGKNLQSIAEIAYSGLQPESIAFTDIDGAEKKISLNAEGDIIIYNSNVIEKFPVIHRIVAKIKAKDGYYFLTKGDNAKTNNIIDQDCLKAACIHSTLVQEQEIQGRPLLRIPWLGCVKLIPFEGRC